MYYLLKTETRNDGSREHNDIFLEICYKLVRKLYNNIIMWFIHMTQFYFLEQQSQIKLNKVKSYFLSSRMRSQV